MNKRAKEDKNRNRKEWNEIKNGKDEKAEEEI